MKIMKIKRNYLIKIAPAVLLVGTAYWLLGSDFFYIFDLVGNDMPARTGIYASDIQDIHGL